MRSAGLGERGTLDIRRVSAYDLLIQSLEEEEQVSDVTEPLRRRGLRPASAIAALCCGLALVACGGSSSGGGGTSSGTSSVQVIGGKQAAPSSAPVKSVTWGIGGTPQALNAFQAYDIPTIESLSNIQEGLLTLDGQGRLQPALADSWKQVDPVTYT